MVVIQEQLLYARDMTVDITASREHLADFLSKNRVGLLATADSSGRPHAATIYITHDRQFDLYFITKKDTQKSRNLQSNNRAAIAIYDADSQSTVQAEGTVVEVTDPKQLEWIFNDIWRIALQVSPSSAPPQSQLSAGGYVAYRLIAPALRIATFMRQDPAAYDKIFEVVNTQPSRT